MKVICINPSEELILGKIYTVLRECVVGGFHLQEIQPRKPYDCFRKDRFKPIEEKGDMFIGEFITIDEEEKEMRQFTI